MHRQIQFIMKECLQQSIQKMKNQLIDINLFLPKFYPKEQQISLKLNPLLRTVRQTNVVSYHQLQNNDLFSKQLQNYHVKHQPSIKIKHQKRIPTLQNKRSIFDNQNTVQKFVRSYESNFTSQKNRKQAYSTLQMPDTQRKSYHIRNDSFNERSKTSDKTNKKHKSLIPGTADFARNVQQVDLQRLNLFIKNPQSQLDFDEDLCNYIRLKMLTKNPYFSGGKSSKIKKHLVEDINLQQIEKKFFKSSTGNTKYKQFFEQIMLRKKQNSFQISKFNKTMYNTLAQKKYGDSKLSQKEQQSSQKIISEFNLSKYSQQIQRQGSPFSISGVNPERNKKMSFKARFLFRKSRLETKEDTDLASNQNFTMQVTGSNQSASLEKDLLAKKQKLNAKKGLQKQTLLEYA